MMAALPAGTSLGEEPFAVMRDEYTVVYRAYPEPDRYAWRSPQVDAHAAEFRQAGATLAANVFDLLRLPEYRERVEQSPYPRLRALLAALGGSDRVIEGGRYCFADPATGAKLSLADVP